MIDYQKEYRQIHRIAAELHLRNERLLDRLDSQTEEIERLREALRDIERGDYSDPMCERTPEQRARDALEGKP